MEGVKVVARNRKARHDYHIEDTFEAGLVLRGTEVKSLRQGKVDLSDGYAAIDWSEAYLCNVHISPYQQASHFNHEPDRRRKLLLHRREINSLIGLVQRKGYTIVPLEIYFKRGYAKALLAVARGKKHYDKRETIAKRDAERRMRRAEAEHKRSRG